MSNKIYDDGFYNEYQKKRYLKTLPEKAIKQATRVLSRVKSIEETYDMDLYNFNLDQIEKLLSYLSPATLSSSRSNFYVVQNYIRWSIGQDLREGSNLNPLETLSDKEYVKKFIDNTKKSLYTKDEVDKMIDICVNAQDSVVISLLFEGALGSNGYDELLNLNKHSLQPNNTLELKDGNDIRYIKVTDKCYSLIQKALEDKPYYKKNGDAKTTLKSSPEANMIKNDYVLRNVETRTEHNDKADPHLVSRRLAAVKEYNDLKVLTPYTIRNSGMLWMAKQLYDVHGELGKEQYEEISEQFGISRIYNNKYSVYNYHRLKDDFLNIKKINELYGE